jgi:putative heme-binding domain-containing protein
MISGHPSLRLFLRVGLVLYAGTFHCNPLWAQQHDFWGDDHNTTASPGQRPYNSNCAGCHGLDGRGSDKGPNIAASVNVRHLSDARVSSIISEGIAGTGMPAFHSLSERQNRAIVTYIRILQGRLEARTLPGNATSGKEVFFGKGECSTCHAISGEGGFLGRDLSTYGSDLPAKVIRDEIVKPDRIEPHGYRSAALVTHDGNRLEGVIRNEDNFSVQLQTRDGGFHFFQKSDLRTVEHLGRSLMPNNYGERLSTSELNDLVSYLMNPGSTSTKTKNLPKAEDSTE